MIQSLLKIIHNFSRNTVQLSDVAKKTASLGIKPLFPTIKKHQLKTTTLHHLIASAFSLLLIVTGCTEQSESITNEEQESNIYEKYQLKKADELVLDAFNESDVVILGENHFIREQVLFVADLIPHLYEHGVYKIYSEFTYLDDAELVDELINADVFDEQLAKNLLVRSGWDWTYQEYMELYRSAWALNKTISDGKKFQIIGLELGRNHDAIQSPEDWQKSANRMAYFRESEEDWATRIISETVDQGEKALVYCGYNHGLTFYRQPVVSNNKLIRLAGKERVGQHLHERLKDNCKYLLLHAGWEPKSGSNTPIAPLNGRLDQLVDSLTEEHKSYGFYTEKSSLGSVIDTSAFFSWGYPDFKLTDLCDGYIVVETICESNLCGFIPNFIDSSNIEIARPQVRAWENIQNISIEDANNMLDNWYQEQRQSFEADKTELGCK